LQFRLCDESHQQDNREIIAIVASQNSLDNGCVPKQEWFVKKIIDHADGLVLDCGCGRGLWSRKLRETQHDVVGLDSSIRRLNMSKAEMNNPIVIRASCTHLPFRADCFSSVLLVEVIEHLDERDQIIVMQEINRILAVGGVLIMTTPNKHIYRIATAIFFRHNPEHLNELTYAEAKALVKSFFDIILIDGKVGGSGSILDHIPPYLCWDLLFVGRKRRAT